MPEHDSASISDLISGLVRNGELDMAVGILHEFCSDDDSKDNLMHAYNTLIACYGKKGHVEEARCLFDEIPDDRDGGEKDQRRFRRNVVSWNSMMMSYVKARDIVSARELFDSMVERDTCSWNTLILFMFVFLWCTFCRLHVCFNFNVVESVGDQVTTLKEGDVVILTYIGECETCENCVSGQTNLCLTHPVSLTGLLPDDTSRMSVRGQRLYHVLSCATWSEYMVSDVNYVLKVDPTIDPSHASFISCGFSTGFGAAWKEAKVESGSSVAVLGLGAVGLGAISGAKFMGAAKIIGIDKNEKKREKGEAFGMTHFINPTDSAKSVSDLVKEATGGMGVDYSLECTGIPPLLTESLEATKVGTGKTMVVGIPAEPTVPLGIITILLGRTLKGSVLGGLKVRSDLSIIADKCQKKEFPLEELFSHEVSLEDIKEAFEIVKKPNCLKIVIKMSH